MEKEYYIIKPGFPEAQTKDVYPQILPNFIPLEFDPLKQLKNQKGNLVPDKFELRLDPKTVLTDFVSVSYSSIKAKGLLMSPKAYEVIAGFKLQDHELYQPKIGFKKKTIDYVWLNPTFSFETAIDYENTVFSKYYFIEETTKAFKATDAKDLVSQLLDDINPGNIYCRQIYMKDRSVFEYDLFLIYFGVSEILISKEMLEALTANKLTGFEVEQHPVKIICTA